MTASLRRARALLATALLAASALVVVSSGAPDAHAVTPRLNGKIVFTKSGQLASMNPDGSDLTQLTTGQGTIGKTLMLSGDGKRIAFASAAGADMNVMNIDGSDLSVLFRGDLHMHSDWSPDGSKFVYFAEHDMGDGTKGVNIFTVDVDGSHPSNVLPGRSADLFPVWSPDGTKIAFQRHTDGFIGVWLMNSDGSNAQLVASPPGNSGTPRFSPDGNTLVFGNDPDGADNRVLLYLVNLDGSNLRQVGPTDRYQSWPAFSPDGSRLVFSSRSAGRWLDTTSGIYTMKVDGSDLTQIISGDADYPRWALALSNTPPPSSTSTTTTSIAPTTTTSTTIANKAPIPWGTLTKPTPRRLNVSAAKAYDPDGTILKYAWYWGDGTTPGWTKNASHAYSKPGNYMVSLSVTDNKGARSTGGVWIRIT